MRVGISAQAIGTHAGGIESYVRLLIQALPAVDPEGDYVLFLNAPLPPSSIPGSERMRQVVVHTDSPLVRVATSGPASLALIREHIDVVHVQVAAPLLFPSQMVVTLHDVVFECYPHLFPPSYVKHLRVVVPLTLRRAAAVLTVSEYSKRDIVRRYRVPPDNVTVAHGGPDPMFRPLHDAVQLVTVRERYKTGERFIVCVAALEPHKNIRTLIEAYVRLRQADALRHKLVLVGKAGWFTDDTFAAARASGYADELVFTGYVPEEDLVALLNAADVFVYPSLFEGFGLPPLEAMACGTPVITSNTAALPEVVGDAGLLVDPRDAEALAGAIASVLQSAELRARLSTQSLLRARSFSWETAARSVVGVYHKVMCR